MPPEDSDPSARDRDLADRLLGQRIVLVGGRLDTETANQVLSRLLLLGGADTDPITLHLACSEADLEPALALADAIDLLPAPVHAVVRGRLPGPAAAVLCAATRRAAHPHALFVLSLPQASVEGTAGEVAVLAEQHERQVAQLRDRIAEVTGRAAGEVEDDLRSGRVLSGAEARAYGLLDELL